MGTLTISQKTFADELVKKFCVTSTQSIPLRAGVKLEDFDEDEMIENWPFRELVGSLMWLSVSTRLDISNAVRAVERYCTAPRAIHWKAALALASWNTLMGLVSTVLHFREGLRLAFRWKYSRMLTTPLKQLTGGPYQVE